MAPQGRVMGCGFLTGGVILGGDEWNLWRWNLRGENGCLGLVWILLQVPSVLPVQPHTPIVMGRLATAWWHLYVIDCVPSDYELN